MITGEERLREYLGDLYGDVNGYEGRPTDQQLVRAAALAHELDDVIRQFIDLASQRLPALNTSLGAKKLPPFRVIPEDEWTKSQTQQEGGGDPRACRNSGRCFWDRCFELPRSILRIARRKFISAK